LLAGGGRWVLRQSRLRLASKEAQHAPGPLDHPGGGPALAGLPAGPFLFFCGCRFFLGGVFWVSCDVLGCACCFSGWGAVVGSDLLPQIQTWYAGFKAILSRCAWRSAAAMAGRLDPSQLDGLRQRGGELGDPSAGDPRHRQLPDIRTSPRTRRKLVPEELWPNAAAGANLYGFPFLPETQPAPALVRPNALRHRPVRDCVLCPGPDQPA